MSLDRANDRDMLIIAIMCNVAMVVGMFSILACNANQGVERLGTVEVAKTATADTTRSSIAAVHNEASQPVATSQPVRSSIGGLNIGGGTTNNNAGDLWKDRIAVWGAIGGSFAMCLVFSRWQAKRHGYWAQRRKRLFKCRKQQ